MTLFYHNVSLQFTQLSLLRAWHWIVIFVSQNTVSLNEQKVKPGVPLCLDFDLNAYQTATLCWTSPHSPPLLMFKEVSDLNGSSSSQEHVINLLQYLHFFIINNTNLQHFQVFYFVSISTAEGPLILPSINQSLFHMSLLNELLSSLLQVGQLYAQQGAVRESFRQFVDGLTLARHFALPYRYSL